MSRGQNRRAFGAVWLAGWCALVRVDAAEERAPAAPSKEDAISAVKRDFEAVKSAGNPALQPKGQLPRMTAPELRTAAPAIEPRAATREPMTTQASPNWLLDAMEQRPTARGRSRETPGDFETPSANPLRRGGERESSARGSAVEFLSESQRELVRGGVNPLTHYLGSWMTPQDFALLGPRLNPGAPTPALTAGAPTGTTPAASPTGVPGTENKAWFGGVRAPPPAAYGGAPPINPYLAALEFRPPTSGLAPATLPTMVSPSQTVLPAAATVPPPVSSPQPKIPEFVRPLQDEKYFKQLKRF